MGAKNKKELERLLLKHIQKAMDLTSKKVLADMQEETNDFYVDSRPIQYQRTGALGDTPNITATIVAGNTVSFQAYLDVTHKYITGDTPTMQQVLELANYGKPWRTASGRYARATIGKQGFWERAKLKMEKTLYNSLRSYFNNANKK